MSWVLVQHALLSSVSTVISNKHYMCITTQNLHCESQRKTHHLTDQTINYLTGLMYCSRYSSLTEVNVLRLLGLARNGNYVRFVLGYVLWLCAVRFVLLLRAQLERATTQRKHKHSTPNTHTK